MAVCALGACAEKAVTFQPTPDQPASTTTTTTSSTGASGSSSGSRLRQQFYTGADGSRIDGGFIDTQLSTSCTVAKAGDGKSRCLPFDSNVSPYFSDVVCTDSVVLVTKGCAAPKYARGPTSSVPSCGAGASVVYALGPKVSAAALYVLSGSKCVGPSDASASSDAYLLGAPVPPTTFVEMTPGTE